MVEAHRRHAASGMTSVVRAGSHNKRHSRASGNPAQSFGEACVGAVLRECG